MKRRITLWMELEPRCNLSCSFCYNYWKDGLKPAPQPVPTEHLLQAAHRLLDNLDCDGVALSGGEPLLFPDLDKFVALFADRSIPVVITTNGTLLSLDKATSLRALGATSVQIPLHSTVEAVHDELSGSPCWTQAIHAIENARIAGLDVVPVTVITRKNVSHLVGVVQLTFALGLTSLIVNRFVPGGAGALNSSTLDISEDEFLRSLWEAAPVAEELGISLQLGVAVSNTTKVSLLPPSVEVPRCNLAGIGGQLTIDSEGNLKHCSQSPYSLGSLVDEDFSSIEARLPDVIAKVRRDGRHACECATLLTDEEVAALVP